MSSKYRRMFGESFVGGVNVLRFPIASIGGSECLMVDPVLKGGTGWRGCIQINRL